MSALQSPDFVLELLAELRQSRYQPMGWWHFFERAWRRSRSTAQAHPELVRSWARVAAALTLAEALALALDARLSADSELARRALPGAALCLTYAQFDAYVHLGMNQSALHMPLYPNFGLSNALTQTRRALAGLLWGHLFSGSPAGRRLILVILAAAGATDIADGAFARATSRATRLGAYLDSVADLSLGLALALTLDARRLLPRWLVVLLVVRWLAPLVYVLTSYLGWSRRIPLGATRSGRVAGMAYAVALATSLLPQNLTMASGRLRQFQTLAHLAAAGLLVAAPLMQMRRVLRLQ